MLLVRSVSDEERWCGFELICGSGDGMIYAVIVSLALNIELSHIQPFVSQIFELRSLNRTSEVLLEKE